MRVIIFDFDGTIADSFATVISIAFQLTKSQQLADIDQAKLMRDSNSGLLEAVKGLNIPKWKWPYLLLRGKRLMSAKIHQVPLFPGMDEVLLRLQQEKFDMYIISTNSKANVERFLLEKGLLSYFKNVYGGVGLFDKAKIIKKLLHEEQIAPSDALYVGDEVRDVMAAKQLNVPCVAVSWGYNSVDLLLRYAPMVVVRSTSQLEKVIIEWSKTI